MKKISSLLLLISAVSQTDALLISEIMSNPTGNDDGREWIEIYNNTETSIDLSNLTVSIKGGTAVATTPLSGGTTLSSGAYAIIGSTVSGATRFLQDYPSYGGPLFRSSISLVNTGVTSIEIKLSGATADTLSSYTAAKEGHTLSLVNGSFIQSNPTPGSVNEASASSGQTTNNSNTATATESQATMQRQSVPSPDITLYMPFEKTVIAGAPSTFSTYGMTRAGKNIEGLNIAWAFGDGGQGTGTSTIYRYVYPGRYLVQVEASNGIVSGTGVMKVRVVPPDMIITKIDTGKYGTYVDIFNPNHYDLDLSQWKLSFDGIAYPFPKNTLIAGGATTRLSGVAMGFANTTITDNSVVKILFPNLEDVTIYVPSTNKGIVVGTSTVSLEKKFVKKQSINVVRPSMVSLAKVATTTQVVANNNTNKDSKVRDTRIISWFKSFF